MLKYTNTRIVTVQDWDNLVEETYKRPYSFQQQYGCQGRGVHTIIVPSEPDDFENDTVSEIVNGEEMGVSFNAWLERDPKQPLPDKDDEFGLRLWWERNFYPDIQMIANDLHAKGLIEAGEYIINIDW